MALRRKQRFRLGRFNPGEADEEQFKILVTAYLNHIRDILRDLSIIVPGGSQSPDPEEGELLLEEDVFYCVVDGEYRQIWP